MLSRESRIGLFVLVALSVLMYFVYRTSDLKTWFKGDGMKTREVSIYLEDASGMREGTSVEIAGVKVGKVLRIQLEGAKAAVVISLHEELAFRTGARAETRTKGVLGERYIGLNLGSGDLLPIQDRIDGSAPPDLGQITANLNELAANMVAITESLKQSTLTESGDNRVALISANIERLTGVLVEMLQENRGDMRTTSSEMAQLTTSLSRDVPLLIAELTAFSKTLTAMSVDNRGQLEQIVKNMEGVTENFKGASASLGSITGKVDQGTGTIGKLINEPDTIDKFNKVLDGVNESLGEVKKLIGKANTIDLNLIARSEYFSEFQTTKNYFGIKIKPSPDKYYLVEGVSLGDELTLPEERTQTTYTYDADGNLIQTSVQILPENSKDFLINGQLAYKVGPVFVRGGFIESEGGGGLDFFTFQDRLKFSLDAYDFSRKDLAAHGRFDLRFDISQNLFINAGYDDFLESSRSGGVLGAGVRWKDDDLKLLFTQIGKFR